jgi:Recombinase
MLQRPVTSYANGRDIVITLGQDETGQAALSGPRSNDDLPSVTVMSKTIAIVQAVRYSHEVSVSARAPMTRRLASLIAGALSASLRECDLPDQSSEPAGLPPWSAAIRAILINPRYTGRQVWNRQGKDEVLIDVHDVAHPPIITTAAFSRVQDILAARGRDHAKTSSRDVELGAGRLDDAGGCLERPGKGASDGQLDGDHVAQDVEPALSVISRRLTPSGPRCASTFIAAASKPSRGLCGVPEPEGRPAGNPQLSEAP